MPVERERGIYALRLLAVAVAVLVAGRLLWYPLVFDDPGSTPILNWLLWGYGVPAAAFALAAKLLRERRDDVAVRAFEALAIAYAALLASLEVRHPATGGHLLAQGLTLAEVGAQTSVALAFALGLRRLRDRIPSPVILWGSRVFGYGSLLLIAIALGRTSNPLFSGERVEGGVIFNALLVGYALPALLAALLARAALSRGEWTLGRAAGALSLGLVFLWVTLNVRLFFRGPVLLRGVTEGAELYAYSAAWLAFSVRYSSPDLRPGSVRCGWPPAPSCCWWSQKCSWWTWPSSTAPCGPSRFSDLAAS